MKFQVTNRLPKDPDLLQLTQDLVNLLAPMAEERVKKVTAAYQLPFLLALPRQPDGIQCVRIVDPKSPSAVSTFTGAVDFVWTPQGASITEIRGLTPSTQVLDITFIITYG